MTELCIRAIERKIEVDYVTELIRKNELVPDTSSLHLEKWPWPVKIYALGNFRIEVDGKPLQFSRKAQKKPLELIKALIALGGKGVSETRLTDALWPEADGDLAHQTFKTTLHRLRKIIGNDQVLVLRDGRLILDDRHCWVDVFACEQLLAEDEGQWEKSLSRQRGNIDRIKKAIELYKGSFLVNETEYSWMVSMRERMRSKFIINISKYINYLHQQGDNKEAIDYCLKAIEIDNLAEEFYQKLMISYVKLGRKAEAISVYEQCKRTLNSIFGIDPSNETTEVYQSITPK
jgi:two-component SAPR family response regulator